MLLSVMPTMTGAVMVGLGLMLGLGRNGVVAAGGLSPQLGIAGQASAQEALDRVGAFKDTIG